MERIGVRELRQHASRYLDKVKAGETVQVTERGQLVAFLVPPPAEITARERLIAEGKLIPATRSFRLPTPRPLRPGERSTAEVLVDLREERLP
ncbi:MAG: type II toxin-antitoxin system Phd/YefM family antitoxin [Actinopolymorphaceae bacterium]|jgi:prevent-host-death family protein